MTSRVLLQTQEEEKEIHDADVQVLAFFIIIASLVIGYLYERFEFFKKIEKVLPNASFNMIFGIILGAILGAFNGLSGVFQFSPEFFFVYLLPPIIFTAGVTMPKDFFFHNFATIMALAFIGTLLCSFFIGGILFSIGNTGAIESLSFTNCMIMGSLISAVDPVAVILALKTLNVDEQLKVLLFGESVLNDAVAVVINRVFVSVADDEKTVVEALAPSIPLIFGIGLASIIVGILFSLLLAFIFKHIEFRKYPKIELGMFLLGGFIPYALCEALTLSGIMSVLFAGIMFDFYTYHHLSFDTKIAVKLLLKSLSSIAESFIFVYLGMSFFLNAGHIIKPTFIIITLILCIISRFVTIYPLVWFANFGRKHKIPFKHACVLAYAGLRGPVAYALAVATPVKTINNTDGVDEDVFGIIVTTTIFIVLITTLLLGGFSFPFIKCLKPTIMTSTLKQKTETYDISNHWFNKLDKKFLKPWFGPISRSNDNPLINENKTDSDMNMDPISDDNNNNNNNINSDNDRSNILNNNNNKNNDGNITDNENIEMEIINTDNNDNKNI